jgi:two-component system, chemotaxis family, protein-glutamate methylesterase/glutaminase
MIKVLIVEDSPTVRRLLRAIIESDSRMTVIGEAANGEEAVTACRKQLPDVISMDIAMPKMDGIEATRVIMAETPCPIVIATASLDRREDELRQAGIDAGALAVLPKPSDLPGCDPAADELLRQLRVMSGVRVVRRRQSAPTTSQAEAIHREYTWGGRTPVRILAIGASTGGPPALQLILKDLPTEFPVPIVIVQHISLGFVKGFVSWLDETLQVTAKLAEAGERLVPGNVYIAPDEKHMRISRGGTVVLRDDRAIGGHRPAVNALFESVAEAYSDSAAAVLLTGMGKDGALGLKAIRNAGGRTLAQDEASCVVFGMPKEAILAGAAEQIAPLERIAVAIKEWTGV